MTRWPRATTTRIAVIVFVALAGSSALLLGFIARVTQGQLDADARALITAERDVIVATFAREGPGGARAVIAAELRIPGPLAFLLGAPDGTILAGNIRRWPTGLIATGGFQRRDLQRSRRAEIEPFAVTATRLPGGYRLMVGRSLAEEERLTQTLTTSLIAAIGLALALAFGISLLLTRIIAARVQGIADVAAAVAAGDLSRRVPVPADAGDAFDSLGLALNAMLARIEALLDELRSVTDGLAHDLRSPLTRMKARIDRLTRTHADEAARPAIGAKCDQTATSGGFELVGTGAESELAALGGEADALLAMLDNSLEISRLEAGIGRDAFEAMDLATLVVDMAEMYEPLAEDNGVRLTVRAPLPVPVRAHRALLGRALSNLIDNALRHAASGKTLTLTATATAAGATLTVGDHGPGIIRTSRDEALRRFGRLDSARSAGGAGLGLSLAAAIARLHGGTLVLSGNDPGLKVTITLPA